MDDSSRLFASAFTILLAMAALAALELAIPLRARDRWSRSHLRANLTLSAVTFATNAVLSTALVLALAAAEARGLGLLHVARLPSWAGLAVALLVLDLGFYLSHLAMHRLSGLWRFHRVHHCDPMVDVTTTLRQHPVESLVRYAFSAALALPLGLSPTVFLVYRSANAAAALLEHANVRVPRRVDAALSLVFTWPGVHKVHHSRDVRLTNTNYGNLFSWWDRAFGTFTPAGSSRDVAYGLAGLDDTRTQTALGLLGLPHRASE